MVKPQITKISQVTQEVTFFLRGLGFSNYYIIKIYDLVRDGAVSLTEDDPYWLLSEFPRMGFKRVDEVAKNLGFSSESEERIKACINYALSSYLSEGHSYAIYDEVVEKIADYLQISLSKITDAIEDMAYAGDIQISFVMEEKVVYFYGIYKAECEIARKLFEVSEPKTGFKSVGNNIDFLIKKTETESDITFSDEQKRAIKQAVTLGISIITGGPGTGKTTVINSIINIFENAGLKVAVAAPTGRAAKRIMETSGHEAFTIHRLLDYYYDFDYRRMMYGKNEENPLSYDCVIVDEASMIDLMLMDALILAIKPGTRLVVVGDSNQLPSVSAGNVLADIINSEFIPVTKLNKIYRQDEESSIISNAYRINQGEYPEFKQVTNSDYVLCDEEAILIPIEKQNDILDEIIKIARNYDLKDVQILTPTKKGIVGSLNLNKYLQDSFNPCKNKEDELQFGENSFRIKDRVMQIKNDYSLEYANGHGVFNGEIGEVVAINKEDKALTVKYEDDKFVEYPYVKMDELELSYACTIHKAQGSEFRVVIIPMTWYPPILSTRSLIYTGITRAKEKVIVVGKIDYLYAMVDNNQTGMRNSGLSEKLVNLIMGV